MIVLAAGAGALLGGAAAAHHSFAMFDNTKEQTLVGTVKEFQWTNPHTWLQVMVDDGGKQVEWSIEGSSPNGLARRGWTRTSFKPGDKVTVIIHPLKDGSNGGSYVKATLPDGRTL
jgi:hypothetical protein